ncbi:hypothetical protein NECAME_03593 [Necator americanus]|uniref:Uncharacterized protein n=1 Tax=Necator americanus TaxID=51031 RepID=W2T4Y7_NECAM|nr:hypothetical protein NECAME_03593 [Necator americanus]ETN76027.1 hypothetical protein NECAME_03593 [Necator americanus]
MAGSNRSGNLRDASKSIPLGTLAAQISTSIGFEKIVPKNQALTNCHLTMSKHTSHILTVALNFPEI